jgi:hypothetical protein
MMRGNQERIRNKCEFEDLWEYVTEEPTVLWNVRDVGVEHTLVYLCPVFEQAKYRILLVKAILGRTADQLDI